MKITGTNPVQALEAAQQAAKGQAGSTSFADKLMDSLDSVSMAQSNADAKVADVASGGETDLHDMMISLEEADIALRAMVSVRDKIVEGYQEVMNMTI